MLAYTVVMFAMLCAMAHTAHCLEGIFFFFFRLFCFYMYAHLKSCSTFSKSQDFY